MSTNECAEIVAAAIRVAPKQEYDWANWIAATTALVAVIIGPIITVYTVKLQARASVHSQHRQAWINTLRSNISELLVQYHCAKRMLRRSPNDRASFDETIDKSKLLELTIELQLNPAEPDHKALVGLIAATALIVADESKDIIENERKIISISQSVLKKEWKRVKAIK